MKILAGDTLISALKGKIKRISERHYKQSERLRETKKKLADLKSKDEDISQKLKRQSDIKALRDINILKLISTQHQVSLLKEALMKEKPNHKLFKSPMFDSTMVDRLTREYNSEFQKRLAEFGLPADTKPLTEAQK